MLLQCRQKSSSDGAILGIYTSIFRLFIAHDLSPYFNSSPSHSPSTPITFTKDIWWLGGERNLPTILYIRSLPFNMSIVQHQSSIILTHIVRYAKIILTNPHHNASLHTKKYWQFSSLNTSIRVLASNRWPEYTSHTSINTIKLRHSFQVCKET